jgi:hypothetical protein
MHEERVFWWMLVAGLTLLGPPHAEAQIPAEQRLMIFGGADHDVYLGCLSCLPTAPDSVYNTIGKYGSEISPSSVRNPISLYGNAISPTSACNVLASEPPVLVDRTGKYYGELTMNELRTKRTTLKAALAWLKLACADR